MAKRALIIAYYFPPLGLGGVQRMCKLAKYLPECGYDVTVLTVKHISYPAYDKALLDELPPQVTIARAGSRDPARIAGVLRLPVRPSPRAAALAKNRGGLWPDSKIGWKQAALRLGSRLLKETHHDIILSSSPPMTAHLVGMELHRRFDIPWVADFRDIWESRAPEEVYRNRRLVERSYALLKDIGRTASAITSINANIGDRLATDNVVIPGGFDEDDMPPETLPDMSTEYFELCYLGSVGPLHPIEPFFEAARMAIVQHSELVDKLRLHIIGANDTVLLQARATEYGLADRLVITPYVTHRDSLRLAATAAATLLSVPAGYDDILTGKIFDYLGLPIPTLASVPENGEAWHLIQRHNGGLCIPPGDTDALATAMLRLYDEYAAGRIWSKTDLAAVTRRAAARQFAGLFDGMTGGA